MSNWRKAFILWLQIAWRKWYFAGTCPMRFVVSQKKLWMRTVDEENYERSAGASGNEKLFLHQHMHPKSACQLQHRCKCCRLLFFVTIRVSSRDASKPDEIKFEKFWGTIALLLVTWRFLYLRISLLRNSIRWVIVRSMGNTKLCLAQVQRFRQATKYTN